MNPLFVAPLLEFGKGLINRFFPDPAVAAEKELELFKLMQTADMQVISGQLEINAKEAANPSVFVAGWRPFVGWIGGLGLAYAAFIEPIGRFVATVVFEYHGTFPVIDTTITMQVLFGLLGLGVMRSFDKSKTADKTKD